MIIFIIMLGLCIGSFLNVVISRLPDGTSLAMPPSSCPVCKNRIKFYDNIPVVSFLVLRGSCRYCGSKISWQYPIIEIITGVLFGYLYIRSGYTLNLLFDFIFVSVLICVFMIDLKHEIIPDSLNLFLGISGLAMVFMTSDLSLANTGYGFLAGGGILFLIALVGPMGGGDIKYMAAAGIWLGLFPTILSVLLAFILGGGIGILLIITKVKGRKDYVPFGPFLVMGSFIGYFFFEEFMYYYLKLII